MPTSGDNNDAGTALIPPDDEIDDLRLLNARNRIKAAQQTQDRKDLHELARRANSGNLDRKQFAKEIRQYFGPPNLSKAEADYCAGWAALAAQEVAGAGDEDARDAALVALLVRSNPTSVGVTPSVVAG